jgi:hypothetical protein
MKTPRKIKGFIIRQVRLNNLRQAVSTLKVQERRRERRILNREFKDNG